MPDPLTWQSATIHNAAELREVAGGVSPQRVPDSVREHLNEAAQARVREAAGVEVRFVADGPVTLTLSLPGGRPAPRTAVTQFYGRYQLWGGRGDGAHPAMLGPEPVAVRVQPPERLTQHLAEARQRSDFDPAVTRVLLPVLAGPVTLHDLQPDPGVTLRPPTPAEQPARRIVFYGTSITHGAGASSPHLTYPQMCSAHLHADAINLGLGGACHAEPQLANWIAGRDDWDAAVLALSVNMMGFSDDDFSRRVHDFVHTVATAHPANPVFAITLWPYRGDLPTFDGEGDKVQRFRQHLRDAVASCPTDNAYLLEGPDLLQRFDGLSTDLIHPGDAALVEMARRLADAMQPHLDLPAA